MDQQRSTRAAPICPKCGSDRVIPIVYGLPSSEAFEKAERGEFTLGGCVISEGAPKWQCRTCHESFGSIFERDAGDSTRGQGAT